MRYIEILTTCLVLSFATGCGDDDGSGGSDGTGDGTGISEAGVGEGGMDGVSTGLVEGGVAPPMDGGTPDTGSGGDPPPTGPCVPSGCDPFDEGDAGTCDNGSCVVSNDGVASCMPLIASPLSEGEQCASIDECAPGLGCVSFGGLPLCTQMCAARSVGQCGENRACSGRVNSDCVFYCRSLATPCDIYAQDCDSDDESCTLAINGETDDRYTGCQPLGSGVELDSCSSVVDCDRGLICVGNECRRVCNDDNPCADGRRCSGISNAWQIPYCR